jgi:hypothetical protein
VNKDRVTELRNSIAETVKEFVPTSDARRVMGDVDELVELIRMSRRAQTSWDGREFS